LTDPSAPAPGHELRRATWAHATPFVAWLLLMTFLDVPALTPGAQYAVRTVCGVALALVFRPWRWYPRFQVRHAPLALLVGAAVFIIWVLPEAPVTARWCPRLHDLYMKYAVMPLGKHPAALTKFPFAPEVAGWPLTLVRLAGSAFVIAVLEEFFWRGFLYRWLQGLDFLAVDPGKWNRNMFLLTALFFGLEHAQWFAGILAGLAYGWLYLRTRDIWAAVLAHVFTNYVLGWYVIAGGQWSFW